MAPGIVVPSALTMLRSGCVRRREAIAGVNASPRKTDGYTTSVRACFVPTTVGNCSLMSVGEP